MNSNFANMLKVYLYLGCQLHVGKVCVRSTRAKSSLLYTSRVTYIFGLLHDCFITLIQTILFHACEHACVPGVITTVHVLSCVRPRVEMYVVNCIGCNTLRAVLITTCAGVDIYFIINDN